MEEWDRSMDTVPSGSQASLVAEDRTLRFAYKVRILELYPGSISIRRDYNAIEKLNRLDRHHREIRSFSSGMDWRYSQTTLFRSRYPRSTHQSINAEP